ncbi:DUF4878 domain-containing protein [Campylobacter avium]|uniref:DUF4878 domain-containing protein n=1 Tax=Campylobacter avium TaxID=522485 RepID=UPI002353E920|nr:DUF4878 domain-containing protein [Campylobacter avium]
MKKIIFTFYLCLATVFVACSSASKPEDIALEVNKIMQNSGDVSKIIKYLDLPEKEGVQEIISGKLKQAVAKEGAKIEKRGGLKESKIVEVKENGTDRKVVRILNVYNDDSNSSDNFPFVLKDKEWKLQLR